MLGLCLLQQRVHAIGKVTTFIADEGAVSAEPSYQASERAERFSVQNISSCVFAH
jgi:hypothetical protein